MYLPKSSLRYHIFNEVYSSGSRSLCTSTKGPLSGIRVVDFSRVLAGPYCSQLLGDLGAEVIKIEQPHNGDDTRSWGPPFKNGESAYFISCNRNKMSIALNLKVPQSRVILDRLLTKADVLLENFLTGKPNEFGFGYEHASSINPRLVYCTISGFGSTGVYKDKPGYDGIISAMYGLQHITGERGGGPVRAGVALTDILTGLMAYGAINAALLERTVSGKGQRIETSLMETQLSALVNVASNYLITGKDTSKRWGTGHPSIVPYQTFACAGDGYMFVAIGNDAQFKALCEALQACGVLTQDEQEILFSENRNGEKRAVSEKFSTNANRVKHREVLEPLLQTILLRQDVRFWDASFDKLGFPYGPVRSVEEALCCPQAKARNMVQNVHHPQCGDIQVVAPPVKFSRTPCSIRSPPPLLGEHTGHILESVLGFSQDEISSFLECGAVSHHHQI